MGATGILARAHASSVETPELEAPPCTLLFALYPSTQQHVGALREAGGKMPRGKPYNSVTQDLTPLTICSRTLVSCTGPHEPGIYPSINKWARQRSTRYGLYTNCNASRLQGRNVYLGRPEVPLSTGPRSAVLPPLRQNYPGSHWLQQPPPNPSSPLGWTTCEDGQLSSREDEQASTVPSSD